MASNLARFSHILVGLPGSGKSTLAACLAESLTGCQIISTDAIRQDLYGDPTIQGHWPDIEAQVLNQANQAVQQGLSIIYDATNAHRAWRLDLLQKLPTLDWIGWHLTTPIDVCKQRNEQRSRQVPDSVIDAMALSLKHFPPVPAEGFLDVLTLDLSGSLPSQPQILTNLKGIPRSLINRQNATQHVTLHGYSRLLDFERLLHLLSILIHHPGSTLEEITHRIAAEKGSIYANPDLLTQDLAWLKQGGLLSAGEQDQPLVYPEPSSAKAFATHPYSDWESFSRLFYTIRLILTQPFLFDPELGSLESLCEALQQQGWVQGQNRDAIRKDIEKILKPYQILPPFPMKRGYFTHSGIFSRHELKQIYRLLQVSSPTLENPWEQAVYEMVEQRMRLSRIDTSELYPVRQLGNQSIVDPSLTPSGTLADRRGLQVVEEAMEHGELLEVKRLPGATFPGEVPGIFRLWPLQLVFHQIAWYLGCEYHGGEKQGLMRFERMDRLFLHQRQGAKRSRKEQLAALERLHKLYDVSAGIFLGNDPHLQRQILSRYPEERQKAQFTLELWFSDRIFPFVSEGTRRFKYQHMSPRISGSSRPQSLFNLPPTGDRRFPHRLKVVLPLWSLEDVDLKRWILGFGGEVLVISPEPLRNMIQTTGLAISALYRDPLADLEPKSS
ncbi:WYL domain-containing protein [Thermostichus vulcanus]|uniref:WYL domain-containing protein n=1 Tax=Thermostichus vulcanus TaxID=32053 RepID=UPI002446522B|nr:WYL domain-containing protein [Thermostichus vulcanus]